MAGVDLENGVARGADTIHWAFDDYHQRVWAITQRVRQRFERRDWPGLRLDTVERLTLHGRGITRTIDLLREHLGERLSDRPVWAALKEAYRATVLGRDDFELALTFFNSLTRQLFSHVGVDPEIDFVAEDIPLPYHGWEMSSARMYAVHRVDARVVSRILEDAGFRVPFADLEADARLTAERVAQAIASFFPKPEIEAVDMLRPVFYRNKAAYLIGRVRRGESVMPLILPVLHGERGLEVDALLPTEDEASIVFSFARWYFHADVDSPREVIGFLRSILPRKRIFELYNSLGYTNHGKTEFYRDLMAHIARSSERFVVARGQRGLVMAVFTLPDYEFVFKVIRDHFPPQKATTRAAVMAKYRGVLEQDRVGRLVDFQEFEHLTFPRARFSPGLLDELLRVASASVLARGDDVVLHHLYVQRRVIPLDIYLREASREEAEAALLDWGQTLKDLAAVNIFPGDVLLKNFGVTRHGRVVCYDYDEFCRLADCRFRQIPPARDDYDEMSPEPWFAVGSSDVFPEELGRFLGFDGHLRDAFLAEHRDLFGVELWHRMQESNRRGEVIDFFPYDEARRLRPA